MIGDLVRALVYTESKEEKEKAYRNLEKVGMDRNTARIVAAELAGSNKVAARKGNDIANKEDMP